jgi:cobalamin-dependent methionine synthase I
MLVVAEKINATSRSIAEAIVNKDSAFIARLAVDQAEAGADFIDVNAGAGQTSKEQQLADIEWLVDVVQEATNKPLTIDSDVPGVIQAALNKYRGEKVMINSVSAEPERLESIAPLAYQKKAWLAALAMGAEGIPDNVEERVQNCHIIMNYVKKLGMEAEQIFFDPLVIPISVDTSQGMVTLKTIEKIKAEFPGARTVMGLSNISFGLPNRKLVNRSFLLMAAYAGLDAAILDPLDTRIMSIAKVADMLTGNDPYCKTYVRAHRKGEIVE